MDYVERKGGRKTRKERGNTGSKGEERGESERNAEGALLVVDGLVSSSGEK